MVMKLYIPAGEETLSELENLYENFNIDYEDLLNQLDDIREIYRAKCNDGLPGHMSDFIKKRVTEIKRICIELEGLSDERHQQTVTVKRYLRLYYFYCLLNWFNGTEIPDKETLYTMREEAEQVEKILNDRFLRNLKLFRDDYVQFGVYLNTISKNYKRHKATLLSTNNLTGADYTRIKATYNKMKFQHLRNILYCFDTEIPPKRDEISFDFVESAIIQLSESICGLCNTEDLRNRLRIQQNHQMLPTEN